MGSAGRDRVTGELIAGKEDVTAPYFLVKRRNIAKTRSCSTRLRKGWGTMGSLPVPGLMLAVFIAAEKPITRPAQKMPSKELRIDY